MVALRSQGTLAPVLLYTLQFGFFGSFAAHIGGEGTNHEYGESAHKEGVSRAESLEYELQETSRECMAAENEALRLWEEHQIAEDRSLMLEQVASHRSGVRGGHALMAAMLEWQSAQEHAAELWARYAKAEESAGALRESEVEDAQQGQDVVLAEEQTRTMRSQAEAAQHKGSSLKQAVQKWEQAEERSSETWSNFVRKKSARRARLGAVAASDHASGLEEQDLQDEVEIERVLAEASKVAASVTNDAKAAISADLAAHLEAATELVGAAKDAAERLVVASSKAEAQEIARGNEATKSPTAKSQGSQESQATKESFAQGSTSSVSSSTALGRFNGQPESFTDLSEKFPAPLGGSDGFSVAFTARWDKLNRWSRVLDFGTPVEEGSHGGNNIIVANEKVSNAFAFHIYGNTSNACLTIPGIIKVGEDSRYLCSVDSEGHMRVFQEGRLVGEMKHGFVPPAVHREHLFIGKSNFKGNAMFEGEVRDLCVWNAAVTWDDTEGCASS